MLSHHIITTTLKWLHTEDGNGSGGVVIGDVIDGATAIFTGVRRRQTVNL